MATYGITISGTTYTVTMAPLAYTVTMSQVGPQGAAGTIETNTGGTIGGDLTVNGDVIVTGVVDGRDVAADGTKLDGIESGADVTDTANVTAAGALMDSELTNIAAVKALNQGVATTDSPTFVDLTISDKIIHVGDTDTAIRFPANDTVTVETGGVERVRVNSAGNVGIGTSSPLEPLHVENLNADVLLRSTSDIGNSRIFFGDPGSTAAGAVSYAHNGNFLSLSTNGSERLRITSTGNVGIGTSAPSQKLDVNGSVKVTGEIDVNGSINLSGASTQNRAIEIGAGRTGDGFSFLDLIGDATYTDYGARLIRNAGANASTLLTHRGTGGLVVQSQDAGFVVIRTTATERMRVDPSGNVLIGTSATGASKLRVVGLPTSSAGLSAGDVWNDAGTLKIA